MICWRIGGGNVGGGFLAGTTGGGDCDFGGGGIGLGRRRWATTQAMAFISSATFHAARKITATETHQDSETKAMAMV